MPKGVFVFDCGALEPATHIDISSSKVVFLTFHCKQSTVPGGQDKIATLFEKMHILKIIVTYADKR
jgi:hypothetical protein